MGFTPSLATAASAPGKVLLAGGYLVLDQSYTGLVFALDARMHVLIHSLSSSSPPHITVTSPQFTDAQWTYSYGRADSDGGTKVTQEEVAGRPLLRNAFVETSLTYALTYVTSTPMSADIKPVSITILADNDYYSSRHSSERTLPNTRFRDFAVPLSEAHKTGLGSSAALVTSLIAALLQHFLPPVVTEESLEQVKKIVNNLAQAAHCAAQGKIGSGFDIAAAVHGSCVYRRFTEELIESLGIAGYSEFSIRLKRFADDTRVWVKWDARVSKDVVSLPLGLRLVMCDVDCGSQSVGMVKKVLAWRKKQVKRADDLWNALHQKNSDLGKTLCDLGELFKSDPATYQAGIQDVLETTILPTESHVWNGLHQKLQATISSIRSLMREMSLEADVPIEPLSQTKLLDACSSLPGVIGGVVPGAGGFDAICLLVIDSPVVLKHIDDLFSSWRMNNDGKDGPPGNVRRLGVRQDSDGVKYEDPGSYGIATP
ncbi:MAG: phosphomevalonate kinase [Trizodia sp. TS-e1964]|nr:MAG: phosphomevalonate kinase [Trizodia sp. TS-e1964]